MPLASTGPAHAGAEVFECFLEAGSREEMLEVSVDFVPVVFVPSCDFVADLNELFEMGLRITISGFVVGNDGETLFENLGKFGIVHERLR